VATLPVTLRYPAAATFNGQVYIIGGSTAGIPSDTIYRFDPTTNAVVAFTKLPSARVRESAATLGSLIYAIGGANAAGLRSRAIYAISPVTGGVSLAGVLPLALADTAAVSTGGEIVVAGGTNAQAAAVATIYAVTPISP
jgi:N-acetylneuraminic acid mutarotase